MGSGLVMWVVAEEAVVVVVVVVRAMVSVVMVWCWYTGRLQWWLN